MNTFITKAKFFISTYKWLLIPVVPIIIFIYFIIIIIASNQTKKTVSNQNSTVVISPSPITEVSPQTNDSLSPSNQPEISQRPFGLYDEVQGVAFGKTDYLINGSGGGNTNQGEYGEGEGEFADLSISQKTFPDGSIEYEYQSDDPQRPHMTILKDGVVLFRRTLMPDDTTLSYYSEFLTNPPYTAQGSAYYGQNAVILANPASGIAVVYDPQSGRVYEQDLFRAISVAEYEKKFGKDISAFNPVP